MTNTVRVGIVGGTGYVGGELLRLLLNHPRVEITAVTSRAQAGVYVYRVHPNLRGRTRLQFSPLDYDQVAKTCDLVFTATPHGATVNLVPPLLERGLRVIDMSADFRLMNPADYDRWYGWTHGHPKLLREAVYGLPELHHDVIRSARLVACPGCMATASILGLAPLIQAKAVEAQRIVVDAKIGSSGGGATPTPASHHAERFGGVRAYNVAGHRHLAEIEQELNRLTDEAIAVAFTAHAVNMVRGVLATIHVFPTTPLTIPEIWRLYRPFYREAPFVRIVRDARGLYRLPNPNILVGSNYCDVGFEVDSHLNHLIVLSALDNMIKGASGQGVQCMNLMIDAAEETGLTELGFHPL